MENNKDITIKSADRCIAECKSLVVNAISARQRAADLWDAIRAFRKQDEQKQEETCRPFKDNWEKAKKPFVEFQKECKEHESILQFKMSEWDREQDRISRELQAKIQAQIDANNKKIMGKAEAKGVDPVLKVAPVVQAPPKVIQTQAGTNQLRTEKTVYGIRGCLDTNVRADNKNVAELLAKFPGLFELDWVAFRKLASTGMLDGIDCVEKRTEYVYSQR